MENQSKKQIVDNGNLEKAYQEAKLAGKEILSFKCDEISLVPGGRLEMRPIYDVVYKDQDAE